MVKLSSQIDQSALCCYDKAEIENMERAYTELFFCFLFLQNCLHVICHYDSVPGSTKIYIGKHPTPGKSFSFIKF